MSITKNITRQAGGIATRFVGDATTSLVNTTVNNLLGIKTVDRTSSIFAKSRIPKSSAAGVTNPFTKFPNEVISRTNSPAVARSVPNTDWRVKLTLGKNNGIFYQAANTNVMQPLRHTNGVVFPFLPAIALTHSATYTTTPLTHANYQHYSYSNSDIAAITLSAEFTAQNEDEGAYILATIQFFRSVTKMFFGQDTKPEAGTPPPILFLSGLGDSLINNIPVVVTSFGTTFPNDVDYLYLEKSGNRVPTAMTLGLTLQPVYTRKQSLEFSLTQFAAGQLLTKGYV